MSFLPTDYQTPETPTNYLNKFEEGKTRIRILSSAIVGYELWVDRKPIRRLSDTEFTNDQLNKSDISTFTGKKKLPEHFWAFAAYDYKNKKIVIAIIKQKTVQQGISSLIDDPEWGSPFEYDIEVTKVKEEKKTKYSVTPKPHKALDKAIKEEYEGMKINLKALYEGADPFETERVNPEDVKI
jgi:hypothetical protein